MKLYQGLLDRTNELIVSLHSEDFSVEYVELKLVNTNVIQTIKSIIMIEPSLAVLEQ